MTTLKFKFSLLHTFCLLLLWSCGQVKPKAVKHSESIAETLDNRPYVIIPFLSSEYMPFDKTFTATSLSESEINQTDSIVIACIATNQKVLPAVLKDHFAIDFSKYKRQYVTALNGAKEKEVWVNCFCEPPSIDWKKEIVLAKDGGNCYFNVIVNLSNMTCRDFVINDAP